MDQELANTDALCAGYSPDGSTCLCQITLRLMSAIVNVCQSMRIYRTNNNIQPNLIPIPRRAGTSFRLGKQKLVKNNHDNQIQSITLRSLYFFPKKVYAV